MLDIKFVRKNRALVENNIRERGIKSTGLKSLLDLDDRLRDLQMQIEDITRRKSILSRSIEKRALTGRELRADLIKVSRELNIALKEREGDLAACREQIKTQLVGLPNIIDPSVPKGLPGKPNKRIRRSRDARHFSFPAKDYLEIGRQRDIVETVENLSKQGLNVVFYKGIGAKLQRALINFLMDRHSGKNSYEIFPPVMMEGSPILKMLQGKEFPQDLLPMCFVAYSLCFRKDWDLAEDVPHDLKRIMQFDSVELTKVCTAQMSKQVLEDTVRETEDILELLELPYETYLFTTGNLDPVACKAYSIKVFLPGSGMFLEISVCSHLADFFSSGMNIRHRRAGSAKKEPVHIVNATSLIIPRAMMAILENHQRQDGSVTVPKALRPYLQEVSTI